MRRFAILLFVLLAAAPSAHAARRPSPPGILYSIDARTAEITGHPGAFRLSLRAATPVTWFADRPTRRAGTITVGMLRTLWTASGFAADPPNAALIVRAADGERTHVVELSAPRATGTRVSFRLKAIPNGQEAGFAHADALRAGDYGRARLFIDDAAVSPCPTTLYSPKSTTTLDPSTTTISHQCLLAPGASMTVYPQSTEHGGQSIVTGCVSGASSAAGATVSVQGSWTNPVAVCPATPQYASELNIAWFGFDPYSTTPPTTGTWCPAPPGNRDVVFTYANPAGVPLLVATWVGDLSCPQDFIASNVGSNPKLEG
ncbi:MAG: hypothetical protein ACR2J9_03825 [Gaiellales bacterium]